ncbi:hypothetical protein ACSAZK_01525 [Methanosarcina sp. Mfa9]|uniref:hypothetical protein n=1 Tax=Methanosarcina sp. Mfa9 TaxID=3439063 RepID=UPI003F855DE7
MSIVLLTIVPLASADTSVALLANQTLEVGMVNATCDDTNLSVEYTTQNGWTLNETHLIVARSLEDIPATKKGNPIPGQFEYGDDQLPGVTKVTYNISLEDLGLGAGDDVVIAAHAVVQKEEVGVEDGGLILLEESAWAGDIDFLGKNWATYFTWIIPEETSPIPDPEPLEP